MIAEIEHPSNLDIQKALLETTEDYDDDVKLTIRDCFLMAYSIDGRLYVISSDSGKMFNTDQSLSCDVVTDMFIRFKNNDPSWKKLAHWKSVRKEKLPASFMVFISNTIMIAGIVGLLLAFCIKNIKTALWICGSLSVLLLLFSVFLRIVWHWHGYKEKKNRKEYPVLMVTKGDPNQ